MCSFAIPDAERGRTATIAQAGNAMHVMICGLCIFLLATNVQREKPDTLTSSMFSVAESLFAGL